jgi:uncharacterized membrane protein/predicted DsbA family dithiol-disulfide isomerase
VASAIDYFGEQPAFCADSGCATVRASPWAHPLGVPMPVVGIAYFAAMLALAFATAPRLRRRLATVGGAAAAGLIAVQAFAIGAWCKLCMIADPAAIALAILTLAGAGPLRRSWRALAVVPGVAAIVLALAWWTRAPELALPVGTPAFVAREQHPGEITIVELVDFECPFCRDLQTQLVAALPGAPAPVRVVRKMVPLPRHPHAMPAAIAWCCADAQGKGDAMAAALFAADPAELTPEGCERIAARVGCDLDRYRRDLPMMVGRVASDMLQALAANVRALPTIFIAGERLTGARSTADLVTALARAAD